MTSAVQARGNIGQSCDYSSAAEPASAGAQIAIRTDENCKVLCRINALSEVQAKAFRGKIEDEYRVLMCASPLFSLYTALFSSTSWLQSRLELSGLRCAGYWTTCLLPSRA